MTNEQKIKTKKKEPRFLKIKYQDHKSKSEIKNKIKCDKKAKSQDQRLKYQGPNLKYKNTLN